MPEVTNYMDLPEEIKLQILQRLNNNKELMQSRLVCKNFVPKELGVVIALFGKTGVTVKLNLAPGVETFSTEELDNLDIVTDSSTIMEKEIENLSNLPVSLLQKTTVLITLFSDLQPNLISELDLVLEHCTSIKLFFIVLMNTRVNLNDRMEQLFLKNSSHFTHLTMFPVDPTEDGPVYMIFDCQSLQGCAKLSKCFIIGNEEDGRSSNVEVIYFEKLPPSVRGLGFFKTSVHGIEWAVENLVNLRSLYLEVDEGNINNPFQQPKPFSQELFERLCNLPHLTEMELCFTVEEDRLEPLKRILGEILRLCDVTPGIRAYFKESPARFNEEGDLERAVLAILVSITRPPFGGFKDDDDGEMTIQDDFTDDLD